jgi:hypothetical protein
MTPRNIACANGENEAADYEGMSELLGFLVADCCAGRPEICVPLVDIAQNADCC